MAKHDERVAIRVDPGANGQAQADVDLVRIFNELRDELLSTLLFVLGNREDAKDAAQDSFIKCWNARSQLHEIVNLRAWIFRVAFNTAKDMQRSGWHRRSKPLRAGDYTVAAKEASPENALENNDNG